LAQLQWRQAGTIFQGTVPGQVGSEIGVITGTEGVACPHTRLPVQHHGSFRRQRRVARADPGRIAPGFEGLGRAPPPDRAAADRLAQRPTGTCGQLSPRLATQRPGGLVHPLAGEGLDPRVIQRGKHGAGGPVLPRLPAQSGRWPSVGARAAQSGGASPHTPRLQYWTETAGHGRAGPVWPVAGAESERSAGARFVSPEPRPLRERWVCRLAQDHAWPHSFRPNSAHVQAKSSQFMPTLEPGKPYSYL
jgi:hypothetical protein